MPRKTDEAMSVHVNLRLPETLVDGVDEEMAEMKVKQRGVSITRADAVRVLLWEAVTARRTARERKAGRGSPRVTSGPRG